jgi:hypothetical protein
MELPRFIRLRDAPTYLGMDRNKFNRDVRPTLVEIPLGGHGIAFDRLDLDAWADHHKQRNGRPGQRSSVWDINECQDSPCVAMSGTSKKN